MRKTAFNHAVVFLAAIFTVAVSAASGTKIPVATDFSADAREAREKRIPVLVLYSAPGCPHCEMIRRSHLRALLASATPAVLVREVGLHSEATLVDFDGTRKTHAEQAKVNNVKFVPTVALYDATGRQASPALVGTMLPDFYGQYLADAITEATHALSQTKK